LLKKGNLIDNDSDQGDDEENDNADDDKHSKKKNKEQGRDHKCSFCSKTYLSYPALYTHLKNKHAKGPDGNPISQSNGGRGRGRPKKTLNSGILPIGLSSLYRSHIEPTSDDFFKSFDK
jgi:hypothetical protein